MRSVRWYSISVWLVVGILAGGTPAWGWGTRTQQSIVQASTYVLSQDGRVLIIKLHRYTTEGAGISQEEMESLHPLFPVDPVGAIQKEMYLLQSVRTDRLDPYYAYRMGVLGKMVVQAVAPLTNAPPDVRFAYYADVDRSIQGVQLNPAKRKIVDPRPYFNRVTGEAQKYDQTIVLDYQRADGFRSFARAALPGDASRAVSAVADVWHTIFATQVEFANVEPGKMRNFLLGSIEFYLNRKNAPEAEDAYRRAAGLGILDAETRKEVADRFFAAGNKERAVDEYRMVLVEDPGRRDVVKKISSYYVSEGDVQLAKENLENARDAYATAVETDVLHPNAQRKLIDVRKKIADREARLIQSRDANDKARQLQTQAEEAAIRRNFARAIGILSEARTLLGSVSNEFIAESHMSQALLMSVNAQINQVKNELFNNAQTLSGSSRAISMQQLANAYPSQNREGLQSLLHQIFEDRMVEMDVRLNRDPITAR